MAKDFRSLQIETSKLILTGGMTGTTVGGLIYSGSVATNREGGIPATMLSNVGSDVFLFVSGTKSNSGLSRSGITLFGGDHVVSGSTVTLEGVYRNTAFKTNNFNVLHSDHFLFIDSSAGHVTASLQSAAAAGAGRELVFKDAAGYAGEVNNRIVIKPAGSDKLEGIADEAKIEVISGSISIISDGVGQYYIVGERD